jgi:hypothetical protein
MFTEVGGTLELTGLLIRSHRDETDLADTLHRPATEAQVEVLHEDPSDPTRPTGFREKPPRLQARPEPLRAQTLRDLKIGSKEREGRQSLEKFHLAVSRIEVHLRDRFPARTVEQAARSDAISGTIRKKPGPKVDLKRLQRVAAVYTAAIEIGESPGVAVADDLLRSESRASSLIRQARQYGFLPPTTRGKAKGADLERKDDR